MAGGRVSADVAPPAGRGGPAVVQAGELRAATVESLRALAALGVVIGHVWGISQAFAPGPTYGTFARRLLIGGGFGVDVFFALSGYLLFRPFAESAFGSRAPVDLRTYARNRVLRILPLYYVAAVLSLLLLRHPASASSWLRFLTLTENFSPTTVGQVDGPLWSVVVEVHFYLLLPVIAWLVARAAGGSTARAGALLAIAGVLSLAAWQWGVARSGTGPLWRENLPASFGFFVPGMLVALARVRLAGPLTGVLPGPLAHSDVWLLAGLGVMLLVVDDLNRGPILAVGSGLMVAACVLPLRRGRLTAALAWRPLALLGIASYSLYAWHMPMVAWLSRRSFDPGGFTGLLVISIPVAIAVAALSYRVVETPFLRLRRQWAPSTARHREPEPVAASAPAGAYP